MTRAPLNSYKPYVLQLQLIVLGVVLVTGVFFRNVGSVDVALREREADSALIGKIQDFSLAAEKALSYRQSYALTGAGKARDRYEAEKAGASRLLSELGALTESDAAAAEAPPSPGGTSTGTDVLGGNGETASNVGALRRSFKTFVKELDTLEPPPTARVPDTSTADKALAVEALDGDISRTAAALLQEAQESLGRHRQAVEEARVSGRRNLILSFILTLLLFFLSNAYLFYARSVKSSAGRDLDEAQEIFRLAIEGATDGIFEWNMARDTAFYSKQFWAMLGLEQGASPPTIQVYKDLLHPEDRERVLTHMENYLSGVIAEYLVVFRMKHASGRWVWINARGKALYDAGGRAVRLVGAHTDITHIKAYEEQLRQARDRAESASRAKTDFLAHMSHEIRTPLTAISGIAEIFSGSLESLDDKQKHLVRVLNSSTGSLKDLVNGILDFSRIESGELELDDGDFTLGGLFEQVVSIFSLKAGEKGVDFRVDYGAVRDLRFRGDQARLRQILLNLVGNAFKFTHHGSVEVKAWRESDLLRVEVKDTGIGIEREKFALVFERFRQADNSVSRKYGGTGLGLPISQGLARLMKGDITLESEPGRGSTFTLSVPFRAAGEPQAEAEGASGGAGRAEDAARRNILVVEDYEGSIIILGYLLDGLGCHYDVARTGLEALNRWKEARYDLVLMDIQMPEMDGFTATRHIRRMESEQGLGPVPIIGMTAHALVGDREKCIEAGMDAYLPKPVVEADLKARILEFLKRGEKKVA